MRELEKSYNTVKKRSEPLQENGDGVQVDFGHCLVHVVVNAGKLGVLREALVEHEHCDHVGHCARHGVLRVHWPSRLRVRLELRDQLAQLEHYRRLRRALPEAVVAQRVKCEAPLLLPTRALTA